MTKKIEIVGAKPKKIEIIDKVKRRIEPAELAAALGANATGEYSAVILDLAGLAELGTQLLSRLRSSGGRPALADATEICRVPMSPDDLEALEKLTDQISVATGTKPSPGQLASVLVRQGLKSASETGTCIIPPAPKAEWPKDWNGNREKYRAAQGVIQVAKSTWGKAA
jgi:hypothetical protein